MTYEFATVSLRLEAARTLLGQRLRLHATNPRRYVVLALGPKRWLKVQVILEVQLMM
jgi:hypothetical protein